MARPGSEWIVHFPIRAVGRVKDAARVEQKSGRLPPQGAMIRQLRVADAEGGHKRRMVVGQEASVTAQVQVGGGQALGVVVGRDGGRSLGVFYQWPLQFI